ncbi:VOC family protein [Mastigocoleus testarum]|uniref:Glyxoylase n=1 Tax=Mastigocoleus testarum BC008 TaxID=371196 RepID=A0A0V7ZV76_9CYAN|nr:VOC family protein [Mastigocoleus testarum]KST68533.1 glyxoylase [Mastigocoleus testarum BC008]KST68548.1 glyxoylase [Mastigocoleus testarum BC008]
MTQQQSNTITPHLIVNDAASAIEFYKQAFGAEEKYRMLTPDKQKIMHAELQIGNSIIFLNDEFPDCGRLSAKTLNASPVGIHLQIDDADLWFERAVNAGAKVTMALENAFWGDRYGMVVDPFGHNWSISSHVEELSSEEIQRRAALEFAS